jgi:hypothetical protein
MRIGIETAKRSAPADVMSWFNIMNFEKVTRLKFSGPPVTLYRVDRLSFFGESLILGKSKLLFKASKLDFCKLPFGVKRKVTVHHPFVV